MRKRKTQRGFAIIEFKDEYGVPCSLQKSSAATIDCIWLGCAEIGLKTFVPYGFEDPKRGESWKSHTDDEIKAAFGPNVTEINTNTRMHLTRKQVKALLPHLQKFVETGEL